MLQSIPAAKPRPEAPQESRQTQAKCRSGATQRSRDAAAHCDASCNCEWNSWNLKTCLQTNLHMPDVPLHAWLCADTCMQPDALADKTCSKVASPKAQSMCNLILISNEIYRCNSHTWAIETFTLQQRCIGAIALLAILPQLAPELHRCDVPLQATSSFLQRSCTAAMSHFWHSSFYCD